MHPVSFPALKRNILEPFTHFQQKKKHLCILPVRLHVNSVFVTEKKHKSEMGYKVDVFENAAIVVSV